MREKYETLKLSDLREIAKSRGIKGATSMKKAEIIDLMCEMDEKETKTKTEKKIEKAPKAEKTEKSDKTEKSKDSEAHSEKTQNHEKNGAHRKNIVVKTVKKEETAETAKTEPKKEEPETPVADGDAADGILEVMQDGYGFIRCENYLPGENDVYVAPSVIRKFNLKTGDILKGRCREKKESDKFAALAVLDSVNGYKPEVAMGRWNFENMTPIFPNSRIKLEQPGASVAMRIMDLISPIGKGQRGMIVSPPKAGKTTLLKDVAKSILKNSPDMHLLILLIDERPEEVTDIKESIEGSNVEVIYSTFDELPEHHKRVAEMVMERAKRLVEHGKDVVILLDSITRLTRAYNIVVPPSGRTLSGGLDPAALHMPKKFFGAARNMREGGSLTILATALIETGSKMDDVIYEEFKGTGNMEMVLDRKLQEKRIFPAINIPKSSTRREDLLLSSEELAAINSLRKGFNGMKADDAVDQCINLFSKTRNNVEFVRMVEKQIRY
ncbi:MAG: transcription termination factor Rho [Butyrivibrio sp.]|uniref:transcription termination factor Rho n=1 Tax=Butyrivibrio sp. TaxID=28121 RepID=UPI001B2C255D|nr:transcription termination factor Rho [Butyrivibrio sp.]MBO6242808.1 transcription termination factor Rho [Butyrivibrio sp.]